ncbi:MAG TPA: hypothetical protein VLX56_07495 [Nitrososphaerales archaeon]|nr:hypothetical protein [Nitrososphaerales archaeon]
MPTDQERAEFRKRVEEMMEARIDMFAEMSGKYAEALGAFRAALQKSGFSADESMQIVLKVAEGPGRRPMFAGGQGGHWGKR